MNLDQLNVSGQRVLLRVDFNVPMDGKAISDDTRIRAAIPTIESLLKRKAKVILMSHMGRPKSERVDKYSLRPCATHLEQLLGKKVAMAPDCVGPEVEAMARDMDELLLLENLRFHKEETEPTDAFVNGLAKLGTCYVSDAFGTAHRKHASTYFLPEKFPGKCALGFLMAKEVDTLSHLLHEPKRPFYAIIGGAKVSTKIGVLRALSKIVDGLFIGGGMAYTFFRAEGYTVGDSLIEEDKIGLAQELLEEVRLPIDTVVANRFSEEADTKVVTGPIAPGWQGMDIGPATQKAWIEELRRAKTIFWNGPLGVFEMEPFAKGTNAIARAIATFDATTVAGGGDCVAAITKAGVSEKFTHISTGGGASLEFLEYGHLPGVDVISLPK